MRLAIRTKLTLLVLAVVLPLLAAAAVRFWGDAPDGRRSGQSQLDTANLIAAQLDEVLTGQVEGLVAQSSLRTLDGAQDADLESLAARVRERHPFMRRFVAVSADGRVLGTSGYRDGEPKFLGAEAIEAVLRRGAPEVTAPLASPADGRPIVALIVPVQDPQGKAVAAYGAEIDLEALSRYLNALPLGREQTVAVVATGGDVLARSVSPHELFDKSLAQSSEAATLLRTGSGTAEWPAPDGVMYLAGAASMRRAPWLVMAAVPADAVASTGAGRLKRDVTAFGIATLLALLVAWLIGGRMQRSVSAALVERSREFDATHGQAVMEPKRVKLSELTEEFDGAVGDQSQSHAASDERQRRLRALADVTTALSQQLELRPLLVQITEALAQLTGAGSVVLWEVDEVRSLLVRRAWTSAPSILADQLPASVGLDQGGAGWVAQNRQPLFIEDISQDERVVARGWAVGHGLHSFVGVPVISGDELLGVLTLNLRREDFPTADDRELLTSFAAQAAVAVHNARLFTEATRRRREAEELAQVARMLTESLDVREVADRVVRSVLPIFGVDAAGLRLMRPDGKLEAIAWAGSAIGFFQPGHVLGPGDGLVARAVAEGRAVHTRDVFEDRKLTLTEDLRTRLVESGTRALLAAPLRVKGELIGVLAVASRSIHDFTEDDAGLLQAFADQAALAMQNARLYGEATRRQRESEEVARVAQTLTGSLDVDDIAQRIVASVLPLLHARSLSFRLIQPDGSLKVIAQSQGPGVPLAHSGVVPPGYGISGRVISEGRPVLSADVLTDPNIQLTPEMRQAVEESKIGAFLVVPLRLRGEVMGALCVADVIGRQFTEVEVALLQTFADQAALAIDHTRLYAQTRQRLRHVESIREVAEQVLVPLSLEERLNLIARKAAELFDAEQAVVALKGEGDDRLVIRAGHQLVPGELGHAVALGEGALGLAAAKREGILVNDYSSWPGRVQRASRPEFIETIRATIAYPLLIRGELIGALAVAFIGEGERNFTLEDVDRLATLAAPAALAIEHSRLFDELGARVRQLQETQAQLVQAGKLSAVGQLVSGVAHELNNPLSVVIGYGQLLKGRQLPSDLRGPIDLMVAQGERMAKIVQGLLLFSRQRKPERAPVDLPAVIEQTVALRTTRLRLSGIRVVTEHAADVPPAEGDVHQLQQVFLNLLLNAEHAILSGGVGDTIHIRAYPRTEGDRRWVVVEFEDNGPGIPAEIMPRIFEPFFTTKKVGEGTGLGLSLSYGIIQQHAGRLAGESVPGRTLFTIELPTTAVVETGPVTPQAPPGVYGFGRRALVVDDEPGMVELVTTLLRDSGWQVEVAATGRSALERVRTTKFDVVLSDIRMPDGSGEDFYRASVIDQPGLAKRFVFMTGDTANAAPWQFVDEVGAPVLEKPFTADTLFAALERITVLTSRTPIE